MARQAASSSQAPSSPETGGPAARRLRPWGAAVMVALVGAAFVVVPFWRLAGRFGSEAPRAPSRLYGRAVRVEVGDLVSPASLLAELKASGYHEQTGDGPLLTGRYRRVPVGLQIHQRTAPTTEGLRRGGWLDVRYRGRRVETLLWNGEPLEAADLDPPVLATFYGDDFAERRPVRVDEVPEELVQAILAAEDHGFFEHSGLSASGILRAAWANLRGGGIRQGGSTLTQQLVKNLYLTHERTLGRKLREALLAVLVELRYGKREILEAYLNEIYLGARNGVSLMGVGAASRAYFGKEPADLTLSESALLAGMIRAPALTTPDGHPEAAKERRDWVLGRLGELGWVAQERLDEALAEPVKASPEDPVRRRVPYFADAMRREAEARFGVRELDRGGYALLSTLSWRDQLQAERSVTWGVEALEKGWQKGAKNQGPLQAALVSLDPRSGEILAYVGGRDYQDSQFDRAGLARRQAGSAFKPVVYAAAFEDDLASPASFLEDAPLTVRLAGKSWTPRNHDDAYLGRVSARWALEHSVNTATARLALQVGIGRVVEVARQMGIQGPLDPFPALALGAAEVTPLELATVYSTLAGGGARPPVHGLEAVLEVGGKPIPVPALAAAQRVLSEAAAYQVTSVLQGVIERGTGSSARLQGLDDGLAGKTGTTNDSRDSWFAGYAPDRVTTVWVGYDDNSATRLSGSRAALPIWARFMQSVRPAVGYPTFTSPSDVTTVLIDPATGQLATAACPEVLTEVFRRGHEPRELCPLHGGYYWDDERRPIYRKRKSNVPRWLRRILGGEGER